MQGCGRCSHRARVLRKHGLVAALVLGLIGVGDIGRQGHMAVRSHQGVGIVAQL